MCIRTKKKGGFLWQDPKKQSPVRIVSQSVLQIWSIGLITDAAEETGLTLSEYIRKMVLEEEK